MFFVSLKSFFPSSVLFQSIQLFPHGQSFGYSINLFPRVWQDQWYCRTWITKSYLSTQNTHLSTKNLSALVAAGTSLLLQQWHNSHELSLTHRDSRFFGVPQIPYKSRLRLSVSPALPTAAHRLPGQLLPSLGKCFCFTKLESQLFSLVKLTAGPDKINLKAITHHLQG